MTTHHRTALTSWASPPFLLSALLLLIGLAMAIEVPWSGMPPRPGPLLGKRGVVNNPQLARLVDSIADRRAGPFTIRLSQADLDAEVAWQLNRLAGRLPLRDAWVRPGDGMLSAGAVLMLGPAELPSVIELAVAAQDCRPLVEIRSLSFGGATTGWLQARADAVVRRVLDEGLERGLGFCLDDVVFRPGQIQIDGRVEGI